MPEGNSAAIERIIANTINETARGDPDALAARIVAALAEAGYRILPPNGRENAAPRPPAARAETALSEPKRGWLVPRPRSRDRLGRRQAPSECAIRRSGDRYRPRRVPQRPRKSRARSPTSSRPLGR